MSIKHSLRCILIFKQSEGHDIIIRLPPFSPADLNPIEMIWAQRKQYLIAKQNHNGCIKKKCRTG